MSRAALITGGASGIGLATAATLAAEGWTVVVADRDAETLDDARAALAADGADAHALVLDVTDAGAVGPAVAGLRDRVGPLRGVVTCAGVAPTAPLLATGADLFRRTLDVNVTGTLLAVQAAVPLLAEAGGGAVVTIASVSGFRGSPDRAAYGASKGAVLTLSKVMALELAPLGVRVNCVAPGATETPLLTAVHDEETRAGVLAAIPLARFARPEETAAAIAFLLDGERSSFVCGQTLAVDGGQMIGAGWTLAATAAGVGG